MYAGLHTSVRKVNSKLLFAVFWRFTQNSKIIHIHVTFTTNLNISDVKHYGEFYFYAPQQHIIYSNMLLRWAQDHVITSHDWATQSSLDNNDCRQRKVGNNCFIISIQFYLHTNKNKVLVAQLLFTGYTVFLMSDLLIAQAHLDIYFENNTKKHIWILLTN